MKRFQRDPEDFVAMLDRAAGRVTLLLYVIGPTLAGAISGAFTRFGSRADPELFTTLALVLPVIVVAAVVESGLSLGLTLRRSGITTETVAIVRSMVRGQMYSFIVAETLCLYAVAARHGSTLIVVASGGTAMWLALDLSRGTLNRLLVAEKRADRGREFYEVGDDPESRVGRPTRQHPIVQAYAAVNVRRLRKTANGRLRKAQRLEEKLRATGAEFDPNDFFVRNMNRMRAAAEVALAEARAIEETWLGSDANEQS